MQLTYPGTRISTLQEVFEFVQCADPARQVLWNIESKIDARYPNRTLGVSDFVEKQYEVFSRNPYKDSITVRTGPEVWCAGLADTLFGDQYQSFDWRTIIAMKVGWVWPARLRSLLTLAIGAGPFRHDFCSHR